MVMAFEWPRIHKWEDNLYNYAREWVEEYILEHYEVEEVGDLTAEQIKEVEDFRDGELNEYSPLQAGFSDLINYWESETWEREQNNETDSSDE
jgi:hypothetical protein